MRIASSTHPGHQLAGDLFAVAQDVHNGDAVAGCVGVWKAPPGWVLGGAGWTRCRGGGQSGGAVSSAMAVRAEDSSTMEFPAEQAASRAVMASRLIARGRPRAWP